MHARDLLGLATVMTWHGPSLAESPLPLPKPGLEEYWTASKCRLDRWSRTLHALREGVTERVGGFAPREVHALCDEILTGEIIARLWTAVSSIHDRLCGDNEAEPIARSVLIGHMEARNRVLALIVDTQLIGPAQAESLNRLRRRCECWSDTLLARFAAFDAPRDLAHDPQRYDEFAEEWPQSAHDERAQTRAALMFGSFSAAFAARPDPTGNLDLNARIASALLAGFPRELFDDAGNLSGAWVLELLQAIRDDRPVPRKNRSPFQKSPHAKSSNDAGPFAADAAPPTWWNDFLAGQRLIPGADRGLGHWDSWN
ncbi:MAG: hypothetical protein QM811_25160 [Pirellulales bacterium]